MKSLGQVIYDTKEKMINSEMGLKIKDYVLTTPLSDILYKTMHFFNLTTASHTNEILADVLPENVKYFQENADRVQNIINNLQDEKSKRIYSQMIKYRCTFLKKDHPEFSVYDQYFPKDIVKLSDKEVFIDCGAYTGDTLLKLVRLTKNKYKKIVAFEPDISNLKKLEDRKFKNCQIIQAAVYDKEGEAEFCHDNVEAFSSKLEMIKNNNTYLEKDISKTKVIMKVIDNLEECKDATFIKMDIEGAELNALKGAEKIIRKNHPKLAICIYHSNEDMLNIAEWILSLKLDYKLYVRSHFGDYNETVLYAV